LPRIASRRLLYSVPGRVDDAINASAFARLGDQVEAKLLADYPGEEAANGMLLPTGCGHDGRDRRSRTIP
jgi:hypothetical protein